MGGTTRRDHQTARGCCDEITNIIDNNRRARSSGRRAISGRARLDHVDETPHDHLETKKMSDAIDKAQPLDLCTWSAAAADAIV